MGSATGRFLQRDPIGIYGGHNVYAYVNNSPLTRVDPFGLSGAGKGQDFSWLDFVVDKAIEVATYITGKITGATSTGATGPIAATTQALGCVPDLTRTIIAVDHRDDLVDSEEDLNDAFDAYEDEHADHVKPGG
ncbi:MAG: hypothetical protein JSU63_17385 [Phycisphaerales bacterium]|nr:MAG: hypothetical protein JSU63_17385 [Phycisphaerales bacterium]